MSLSSSSPLAAVPALVLRAIVEHLPVQDSLRLGACCRQLFQALSDVCPTVFAYRRLAQCIVREMCVGKIDRSDDDEWNEYIGFITTVERFNRTHTQLKAGTEMSTDKKTNRDARERGSDHESNDTESDDEGSHRKSTDIVFDVVKQPYEWWNDSPPDALLQAAIEGGAHAAEYLPMQFTGLLMRSVEAESCDGGSNQCEKVVAFTMPDGQEALIAFFANSRYAKHGERNNWVSYRIVLALPGHTPAIVFRMDKDPEEGLCDIYSADKELAKALSVSQKDIREWLAVLCETIEGNIWKDAADVREASALGDGKKASSYMQGLLSVASAIRSGSTHELSSATVSALNDLWRVAPSRSRKRFFLDSDYHDIVDQSVQGSSWPWESLLRLVHDRRARHLVCQLPELYQALCEDHRKLLALEQAPPNLSLSTTAWVEANMPFTYFDDAEPEELEELLSGQILSVECMVGPGPRPAKLVFSADSVNGDNCVRCSLSPGVSYKRAAGDACSSNCGRFWHVVLSPKFFSLASKNQDAGGKGRENVQTLWQSGDPRGDWGGPARFTLLMLALSLSFADRFFKINAPAAEDYKLPTVTSQSEKGERTEANESGDEHSSEYWTSDEEEVHEDKGSGSELTAFEFYSQGEQYSSDEGEDSEESQHDSQDEHSDSGEDKDEQSASGEDKDVGDSESARAKKAADLESARAKRAADLKRARAELKQRREAAVHWLVDYAAFREAHNATEMETDS
ncbi:hypothetical protein HDU88_007518 [Geranomyces variabilis]|nr:hypothetical protein HDU88_007518 [Geranomyces variabilis]